jgi:hypothetical protein
MTAANSSSPILMASSLSMRICKHVTLGPGTPGLVICGRLIQWDDRMLIQSFRRPFQFQFRLYSKPVTNLKVATCQRTHTLRGCVLPPALLHQSVSTITMAGCRLNRTRPSNFQLSKTDKCSFM